MSHLPILREVSREVFKRPHQLEVAQAVAKQEGSFEAEAIIEAVRKRAEAEEVDVPSTSAVRKNLRKLAALHVVNHVASTTGSPAIWTRNPGAFWKWLEELPSAVNP